jgi:peptidoglycan/LPS O-acetylase OafA/YrhL
MSIRKRLLFIDILKIIGVSCVLFWHLFFNTGNFVWFLPLYGMIHPGGIGVILFLIASGAALTYNQYNFNGGKNVLIFYYKRLMRVYPAMWMTILFIFLLFPSLFENIDYTKLIQQITGFYYYFNKDIPEINSSLWFIGLIVILYILYPLLYYIIRKYRYYGFIGIFTISMASRIYLYENPGFLGYNSLFYFGAIPNLWAFCLGIFIITINAYPKIESKNFFIKELSNLSFYVYLIQFAIIPFYSLSIPLFFIELLFSSYMLMLTDNKINEYLLSLKLPLVKLVRVLFHNKTSNLE